MLDLHRHDEGSSFDGFGSPKYLARVAKKKGLKALGISNHGNMHTAIQHYNECHEVGIKPIIGIEGYFQPKFDKDKPSYHLCLFAKNLQGYQNINKIQARAEVYTKYKKPRWVLEDLIKYKEGIICTSACMASYFQQMVLKNKKENYKKSIEKFKEIYGEDFYIEIQPYKVLDFETKEEIQFSINDKLLKTAKRLGIKCIFTSDSHYADFEDFDSYQIMHQIGKSKYDIVSTYGERYMPTKEEAINRLMTFQKLTKEESKKLIINLKEISDKVDGNFLDKLELKLPEIKNSHKILKDKIIDNLKKKNKYNEETVARCKHELDVISHHGFESYFLMVEDYINFAKENNIMVGPGRGSGCNCYIAYILGITKVDPIKYYLNFDRFMRKDKKKLPDIDIDFESTGRDLIIDYLLDKYKTMSAKISSYGRYKVDNLSNELAKVCGENLETPIPVEELKEIKKFFKKYVNDSQLNEDITSEVEYRKLNQRYKNIAKHFVKMFGMIRFIGTHAAGVAITGDKLLNHTSIFTRNSKVDKNEKIVSTQYDLNDIEQAKVIKFDILGLSTLDKIKDLELKTGNKFDESWLEDKKVLKLFNDGNTDGIFQFESDSAKTILKEIGVESFNDIIAANSLNRPGPLSLQMHTEYRDNKIKGTENIYTKFTKDSYSTVVYQEQIIEICKASENVDNQEIDFIIKRLEEFRTTDKGHKIRAKLIVGWIKNLNITEKEANSLADAISVYAFNKGHATGYAQIAVNEAYYKVYHPVEFWFAKIKYAGKENLWKYKKCAVESDCILMLPHANRSDALTTLKEFDNEQVIFEGISTIENIGLKTALTIEAERDQNGDYKDKYDFIDRLPKKIVTSRVVDNLEECGAFTDQETYYERCIKYNASLLR